MTTVSRESENTYVYIGTLPCGCHVAAVVDSLEHKKDVAKDVARMIRYGYQVSRHTLTALRDGTIKLHHCIHKECEQERLL